MKGGRRLQHLTAEGASNPTWIGWRLTVTDRATGETVTGGLSDFLVDDEHGHVWLYLAGRQVELRHGDTVTVGGLDVLGGAW